MGNDRSGRAAVGRIRAVLAPGLSEPFVAFLTAGSCLAVAVVVGRGVMRRGVREREALRERIAAQDARLSQYDAMLNSSADGFFTWTDDGLITQWSRGAERIYGHPAGDVLHRPVDLIVAADRRAQFDEVRARVRSGESLYDVETTGVDRAGRALHVAQTFLPIRSSTGAVVGASVVVRDRTDRLADAERFRVVFEAAGTGQLIVSAQGVITLANREAEVLFGYDRGGLSGLTVDELVPERLRAMHAADRGVFMRAPQRRRMGEGRDLAGLRRDGTEFPVMVSLSPIEMRDGVALVVSVFDNTERQRFADELQAKNSELERSNQELVDFAYVASHDMQEPLRMVVSYTQLLADRYRDRLDDRADTYIEFAVDGGRRMQRLINDLLVYSRVGTQGLRPSPVDSATVVRDVLRGLEPAIVRSGAQIDVGELPVVCADGGQLGQALQNLISNAIKFHGDRPPEVSVSAHREDGWWVFDVADSGIGIDDEYAEQIFLMFRRLHEHGAYEGSGIGLAVVRRIADRHGGDVWWERRPDRGTTFHLRIPASPSRAAGGAGAAASDGAAGLIGETGPIGKTGVDHARTTR